MIFHEIVLKAGTPAFFYIFEHPKRCVEILIKFY